MFTTEQWGSPYEQKKKNKKQKGIKKSRLPITFPEPEDNPSGCWYLMYWYFDVSGDMWRAEHESSLI